jgi:ABC-type polysaccharide/polyol phosphate export permease
MALNLIAPLMYAVSGVVFMADAVPSPYREWIALFPLLHAVEWVRCAYYWDYNSMILDIPYLLTFSTVLLTASLFIERQLRGRILQ